MLAIGTAAVTLGVISYLLVKVLGWLDAAYGRLTDKHSSVSRHVPWLRSMRGERPHSEHTHARDLSPLELILITSVVLVIALFEAWFFFYSPSPIDQRSGRSHKMPIIGTTLTRPHHSAVRVSPAPPTRPATQ